MSQEVCPECDGKGLAECPLEYGEDSHPDECPSCGGDNMVTCWECEGSGNVDE